MGIVEKVASAPGSPNSLRRSNEYEHIRRAQSHSDFQTASLLYELVLASQDVPLWGTCLGLQTLACIASGGVDVLGDFPLENFASPL